MSTLTIGKIARAVGVGVETVRFYERQGLIPPPARSAAGYRLYDTDAIARLQFIGRAKTLGFTLAEIGELMGLRATTEACCDDVRSRAVAKITDIEAKMDQLLAMKGGLIDLVAQCDGAPPSAMCPLLSALAKPTK
jgi:MerR family mercuric resistance operon transcriptional regulator